MRPEEKTGMHLLLAVIATIFSVVLSAVTVMMAWELWSIPLMIGACAGVWTLHIGRIGPDALYETLCSGLLLLEFFFFSVHSATLFDIPAMAGILVFSLFMLNKKWILHVTAALYALAILYHVLVLHTISLSMPHRDMLRLALGAVVIVGGTSLARYWINRRSAQRQWYQSVFAQMEMTSKQNAVFLSNVSHELRTPINMVIGISEVALGKEISPDIRSDISSINTAGKRLSGQINNMLDYTEVVGGTLSPAKEEYMITSVLNDVITSTALHANRQNLELVFDIDPNMPAALIGDSEKISHVLKILVDNSVKFTEEGGVYVRMGYRPENYGVNLAIDIHDTGIGMTDAQLTKIYDDFYQADTGSSRFAGGLGLGLPIARGMLTAMGGFIHFDTKTQRGLHAHIVIPQGVSDKRPCIVLAHPEELCIGCCFSPERYSCDEVRGYYNSLILSLMEGLGIKGYQAHDFESLIRLQHSRALTHIFIAQSEYQKNKEQCEELARTQRVILIADKDFFPDHGSHLHIIHKPFSALSVANLLNGETGERGFAEDQAAGRIPFTCTGVRALAVDDEEMNLVVAKGVLGSYGIEVDTCLSGREALIKCEGASYDIIFLDHMMPGFDGVETLKRIRELPGDTYRDLPVIALTANTVSGAREMFRSEGFTEFVPKPIERAVLERVLRKVLPKSLVTYNQKHGSSPPAPEPEPAAPPPEPAPQAPKAEDAGPASPFDLLAAAGVNAPLGMDYCAGDQEFYREMLKMFSDQGPAKREEIAALYESADWGEYAVKVHALKSTSLTIGAEGLSALAKELELAGKRGDGDFIRERHPALMREHEELCGRLAEIADAMEGT